MFKLAQHPGSVNERELSQTGIVLLMPWTTSFFCLFLRQNFFPADEVVPNCEAIDAGWEELNLNASRFASPRPSFRSDQNPPQAIGLTKTKNAC